MMRGIYQDTYVKSNKFMLKLDELEIVEEEGISAEDEETLDYSEEIPTDMKISIRALNGEVNYTTLRVKGMVKRKTLTILIDSGSTQLFKYKSC